jgi:predicted nucleic acid-binding protein
MTYWDTSALLKLYVAEPESEAIARLAASCEGPLLSSAIAPVEMVSTLARKEHVGELRRDGSREIFEKIAEDIAAGRLSLVPFGDDVVLESARIARLGYGRKRPVMVRALDLIHLASAAVSRSRSIVTTDRRMRELAGKAGLAVLPEML